MSALNGKKIVVTRAKAQASALCDQIKQLGGIPLELPLITCKAIENKQAIHQAIKIIHTYEWLVFTSKNGIDFFFQEYQGLLGNVLLPPTCKIAVVGPKTEAVLATYGLKADLIPEVFVAEGLLQSLLKVVQPNDKILIPRGNLARNIITDGLRENGISVCELDIYETVIESSSKEELYEAIVQHDIDIITFTSSSTVDHFVELLEGTDWRTYMDKIMFASIGPITSKTMRKHQLPVDVEPAEYTIQAMLNSIIEKLKEE